MASVPELFCFFCFLTACVTSSQSIRGSSPCCDGSGASFPAMQPLDLYRLYPYINHCSIQSVFALLPPQTGESSPSYSFHVKTLWWPCVLRSYNCTVAITPEDFQPSTSLASGQAICCPKIIAKILSISICNRLSTPCIVHHLCIKD